MGQHRKTKHYRRIAVTAVAVTAVGVPSVALACTDWPYGTDPRPRADVTGAPVVRGQHLHGRHHREGVDAAAGRTTAPAATAPAAAPVTTAPATAPSASAPVTPPTATPSHTHRSARPKTRPVVTAPKTRPAATARPTTRRTQSPAAPAATPAPGTTTTVAPSAPQPAATASGVSAEILRLVNTERGKVGCPALTLNPALTKAAQAHSEDMAAHRNMSHTGSDGSDPGLRITAAGYTWSSYGENVAYGYATAEQVMAGWMASPGHRANILDCGFREIGVGLAQPGSYWTQDFGTAR
ncbi:CAP domain-containing protein [Streptomyces sp. NPDC006658]|uniref:CAP domain-containing protein n=1 Tax=Streptomyces sp. NPDC006658 TaxID=3156900 RepID=UPI0033F3EA47